MNHNERLLFRLDHRNPLCSRVFTSVYKSPLFLFSVASRPFLLDSLLIWWHFLLNKLCFTPFLSGHDSAETLTVDLFHNKKYFNFIFTPMIYSCHFEFKQKCSSGCISINVSVSTQHVSDRRVTFTPDFYLPRPLMWHHRDRNVRT